MAMKVVGSDFGHKAASGFAQLYSASLAKPQEWLMMSGNRFFPGPSLIAFTL